MIRWSFVGDNGDKHDDDSPGHTQLHGDEDENCEDDDGSDDAPDHHHHQYHQS